MNSSDILDKCIIEIEIEDKNSIMKSLSLTPSILLELIFVKFNSFARKFLSSL